MLTTNVFVDSCTGEAATLFQDVIMGGLSTIIQSTDWASRF